MEERIAASHDRLAREVRQLQTAQQALYAIMDSYEPLKNVVAAAPMNCVDHCFKQNQPTRWQAYTRANHYAVVELTS
jgi:hypothetical protein